MATPTNPRERRPRTVFRRLDGILLLDKPQGLSSNQALQRVRHLFRADKGGHTGSLSPFAFVSVLRSFFDGIVCVGGAIADGAGVAGAVAAGADLVYMGTRFLAAEESMADPAYKQMVVDADAQDLVVSPAITGTAASWLKPSLQQAGYDIDDLSKPAVRDYSGDAAAKWRDLWAAGQGLHAVTRTEPVA